jgi:hypothetical protein
VPRFAGWARRAGAAVVVGMVLAVAQRAVAAPPGFEPVRAGPEASALVSWVLASRDARGRPFAVVDKRAARLYVFHASGRLAGHTPALLGATPGDHIVPGVGERAQTGYVSPEERTTPAGRFEAEPGRNEKGEHVVWVDYASAFAIHRVRPGAAYKARAERLATAEPRESRVSWGCVVVPEAFYLEVVEPVLGRRSSVVYVLPEVAAAHAVFHALSTQ